MIDRRVGSSRDLGCAISRSITLPSSQSSLGYVSSSTTLRQRLTCGTGNARYGISFQDGGILSRSLFVVSSLSSNHSLITKTQQPGWNASNTSPNHYSQISQSNSTDQQSSIPPSSNSLRVSGIYEDSPSKISSTRTSVNRIHSIR